MKKLKCDSCGGELVVDENKEFATCAYCNTKYKLNEDHTITIKVDDDTKEILTSGAKTFSKISLVVIIPIIIISLLIFGLVGYSIYTDLSQMNTSNPNGHIGTDDDFEKEYNKAKDDLEKEKTTENTKNYNNTFEFYSGTQTKNSIIILLDRVITNNKTNKSNLITVKHKNINSTDPNKIVKIKGLLKDFSSDKRSIVKYEVILDYNNAGYVSVITIK